MNFLWEIIIFHYFSVKKDRFSRLFCRKILSMITSLYKNIINDNLSVRKDRIGWTFLCENIIVDVLTVRKSKYCLLWFQKRPPSDDGSDPAKAPQRDNWGNDIEFLMSCIALSVGLGNVWRFPFTALDNGGGAFVIPYIIVLFLVGKPVYYMEMLLGQFSSRGSVKVYDFSPIMRGKFWSHIHLS